jgi:hypothetical protein
MNEEHILIMGDDLALQPINNQSSPASEQTQASGDGSWLADRKSVLAESFLQKHQSEFHDFEQREREKMACAEHFRTMDADLTARRQWLETLRNDISEYRTLDLATVIYQNMRTTDRSLSDITRDPQFSAAVLIKEHGGKILQLAEKEISDLEAQFETFKSEKLEELKELGLS